MDNLSYQTDDEGDNHSKNETTNDENTKRYVRGQRDFAKNKPSQAKRPSNLLTIPGSSENGIILNVPPVRHASVQFEQPIIDRPRSSVFSHNSTSSKRKTSSIVRRLSRATAIEVPVIPEKEWFQYTTKEKLIYFLMTFIKSCSF
jgi:hypothetical protein